MVPATQRILTIIRASGNHSTEMGQKSYKILQLWAIFFAEGHNDTFTPIL